MVPSERQQLGHYQLLERLGSGVTGELYLAVHKLMKRKVVISILPKRLMQDQSYRKRFSRQARQSAQLDHRNIVHTFDVSVEDDVFYLVMEYVDGESLEEIVAQHGPVDPYEAADCVMQAADALQHAHQQKIVHRDIRPDNLMRDGSGTVKVLNMGLVLEQGDLSEFAAPEQADPQHPADPRADLYSLGCVLYFLLTGHPPRPTEAAGISESRPDAPAELVAICETLMQPDPQNRLQSAAAVSEALNDWLEEAASDTWTDEAAVTQIDDAEYEPGGRYQPPSTRSPQRSLVGAGVMWGGGIVGLALIGWLLWMGASPSAPPKPKDTSALGSASVDGWVLIKEKVWNFDQDTQGWTAARDCTLSVRDGALVIECTGGDPHLRAPVQMPLGRKQITLRVKVEGEQSAQVFWTTQKDVNESETYSQKFRLGPAADWTEFSASFLVQGKMTRLRLDPRASSGTVLIDWIKLGHYEWKPASDQ